MCVSARVGALSCAFVAMQRHVCVSMHSSGQMPLHVSVGVCGGETEGAETAEQSEEIEQKNTGLT